MVRTIISLDPDDKSWLEAKARETGLPMSAVVRQAVRRMRREEQESFEELLKQTSGLWQQEDGLKYQRRLRREWR